MTKGDLIRELKEHLEAKGMSGIEGIGQGSRKDEIQNAIECLKCPDETMQEYFIIIKHKYPNIHRTISKSNFLQHSHNRLYVYNTARNALR